MEFTFFLFRVTLFLMKVIAVIPAFNEAPRLGEVLVSVRPHVQEVVVVDDGSHDETSRVAHEHRVHVLRHRINRGQGAALKTGTLAALRLGAEVVVHLDADGQHNDPFILSHLLQPLHHEQADVVYGSRFLGLEPEGMPFTRRALLQGAHLFSCYALGIPRTVTDPQSGLRAMRARVAEDLVFTQDGMAHCSEILRWVTRSSYRWQEVPVRVRYTEASLQKGQKAADAFKITWQLLLGALVRSEK